MLLTEQLEEYKIIIDKLHVELRGRDEEILRLTTVYKGEQERLDRKVYEMRE